MRRSFLAEGEPEDPTERCDEHDDDRPENFRQRPHSGFARHDAIDEGENRERHEGDHEDEFEPGHVEILSRDPDDCSANRTVFVPTLEGVKSSRQWVVYSAIRVGIFAVVLVVLLVVGVTGWIAAIGAAVIGLCVSY